MRHQRALFTLMLTLIVITIAGRELKDFLNFPSCILHFVFALELALILDIASSR